MIIYCTVTNDLTYDQRMIRICSSLAAEGYRVTLVGRKMKKSVPLSDKPFRQKRLDCFFNKGKLFYAEFNLRLFFFLLFKRMDCICVIDLDTILPGYFISKLRGIKKAYDAHELFCEMQEIVTRPAVYRAWKKIEKFTVPVFKHGYTVNQEISNEFKKMYAVNYEVIRSVPLLMELQIPVKKEKYILYQGALNEGRCFETLIPAMKLINVPLVICGEGNFSNQARLLVAEHGLKEKIYFKGNVVPGELREITRNAWIGITLFEKTGLSNYFSLANRFFDYIHAGIPQLCVNYPVYQEINDQFEVAVMVKDTGTENLVLQLNKLLEDQVLYSRLQQNCLAAREVFNWQQEEKKLISFYKHLLG